MRGRVAIALLLLLLSAAGLWCLAFPQWPSSITQPLWSVALYDADGQLLDVQLASDEQWRLQYQQAALPPRYQQALLTFEDQYFVQHPGVNPLAIARASWRNLQAGRVVSGASTISMQLARLAYGRSERRFSQKLKELGLALQLEWHFSKAQLLVMYASMAPYGGNVVGMQSASWWYFGREPSTLSWAEAALLAVLPNNPAQLYPGRRNRALQAKRDRLLQQLANNGVMSALDLELALAEPLPTGVGRWPHDAPHLLQDLKRQWPQQARFDTTLDGALQRQTAQLLQRHAHLLREQSIHNLAMVLLDHQTMQLKAYHGNVTRNDSAPHVDIARSARSSGSILKPLLYAGLLDAGLLLPTSLQADIRSQFGRYSPANFDLRFRGAVPATQALASSLNIPAVRQLALYGVTPFKLLLQQAGLTSITRSADHYGLSLILGGAETKLTELTTLYAAMAHSIGTGKTAGTTWQRLRSETPSAMTLPFSVGAAYLTLQALTEVERPNSEGSWRDYQSLQTIAWKTGTSFGLRDAWAIGSNGRYTVGVWAGNADGRPAPVLTGGQSAGSVLFDVFRLLPKANWFSEPRTALQTVAVCQADGYPARLGCDRAYTQAPIDAKLQLGVGYMQQLWLDPSGQYQLPQGCVDDLQSHAHTRLVLPLAMAWFYQQQHPEYPPVPPMYPGCSLNQGASITDSIALLSPVSDGSIMLPLQGDGKWGAAVFRAITRDAKQTLDWHIGHRYLGRTRSPHQVAIQLPAGSYELVLTDGDGQRLVRPVQIVRTDQLQ